MNVRTHAIHDEYLTALEMELQGLSPADRAEILLDVREHFEAARAELVDPSEADLRNILERLGPPADIAADARQRLGNSAPEAAPVAVSLPLLAAAKPATGPLEVAALVAWVLWWPLGILLTGLSSRWSRRDKVLAVLIELVLGAVLVSYFSTQTYRTHTVFVFVWLLIPPTVIGIFGAGYLAWKLASPSPRRWSSNWRIAGRIAALVVGAWLAWTLLIGPLLLLTLKAVG